MKLLYLSAIEQHAGWGAEYFLNDALVRLGIETVPIDYRNNRYRLSRALLSRTEAFDIFLLQRGDYFPLQIVSAVDVPRVFVFTELVSRCSDADHLFESDLFDTYLVRGPACKNALLTRGHPKPSKVDTFLSAFDPSLYSEQETSKDIDCLFVGSLTPRRKAILDELSKTFRVESRTAFGRTACELFNRAKVVLNIHAEGFLDTETRVYEALGSGAFLISEQLSEESPFTPGKHYAQAGSLLEMKDLLAHYLSHDEQREEISNAGCKEAHEKHTYDSRARQLGNLFERLLQGSRKGKRKVRKDALNAYARKESLLLAREAYRSFRHETKNALKRFLRKT